MIVITLIQFIPRLDKKPSLTVPGKDFFSLYKVPADVKVMFQASCYDCHSRHTYYPWYASIQPVRLLLDKHIVTGKMELNFDDFGSYSERKRKHKLEGIANAIRDNEMPLKSYLIIHPKAKLSVRQKSIYCNGSGQSIRLVMMLQSSQIKRKNLMWF